MLAPPNCCSMHTVSTIRCCARPDIDGSPVYMSKENFSNGSIDTVDVTYPSSPFFLYFNPELLKAQITPIMYYAALPRWPGPYAPHDLGTYPLGKMGRPTAAITGSRLTSPVHGVRNITSCGIVCWTECVSTRDAAQETGLLSHEEQQVRTAARQPRNIHEAGLESLDSNPS